MQCVHNAVWVCSRQEHKCSVFTMQCECVHARNTNAVCSQCSVSVFTSGTQMQCVHNAVWVCSRQEHKCSVFTMQCEYVHARNTNAVCSRQEHKCSVFTMQCECDHARNTNDKWLMKVRSRDTTSFTSPNTVHTTPRAKNKPLSLSLSLPLSHSLSTIHDLMQVLLFHGPTEIGLGS